MHGPAHASLAREGLPISATRLFTMNSPSTRQPLAMGYVLTASYFFIATAGVLIDVDLSSYIGILFVLCYVCSVVLLAYSKFTCLYYVQMLTFFVITYALQTSVGARYLGWMSGPSAITTEAASIFAVHLIAVTAAATLAIPQRHRAKMKPWRNSTMFLVLAFSLLIVGFAVMVIGREAYFGSRSGAAEADFETWQLSLEFFSKSLMYMIVAGYVLQLRPSQANGLSYFLISIALVAALIIANPVNTARFVSLSGICVALLATAIKVNARKAVILSIVAMPMLLIAVLPITSLMRYGIDSLEFAVLSDMGASLEFSQMQLFLDTLGYLDGRPLFTNYTLTSLLIFIPRAVWEGKSFGLGPEVADYYGYVFSNVALPSFVYFYADYGYIGLLVGSTGMGWFFGKININFTGEIDLYSRRMMYGLLVLALIPIIARGDLTTSMLGVYSFAAAYEMVRLLGRLAIRPAGTRVTSFRRMPAQNRMGPPLR